MRNNQRARLSRASRLAVFALLAVALVAGGAVWGVPDASANHPVFVEGNCDSPFPGTVTVPTVPGTGGSTSGGICGDFDGDGRIGTAEDTDGADRIFGTINAALGPGTGAAAGTGANHNGRITIVKSGRFAETLYIGQNLQGPSAPGVANPGNVTIEAAPGVEANIDAILQGDPAGGNLARTASTGIQVVYTGTDRVVTLRNLVIRNFANGIQTFINSRVHIDNCRLEHNLNYGIQVTNTSRVVISNTKIDGTGRRTGIGSSAANPGTAILVQDTAKALIEFTTITHSAGTGIDNITGSTANVVLFKVGSYFNTFNIANNGALVAPNPNFATID